MERGWNWKDTAMWTVKLEGPSKLDSKEDDEWAVWHIGMVEGCCKELKGGLQGSRSVGCETGAGGIDCWEFEVWALDLGWWGGGSCREVKQRVGGCTGFGEGGVVLNQMNPVGHWTVSKRGNRSVGCEPGAGGIDCWESEVWALDLGWWGGGSCKEVKQRGGCCTGFGEGGVGLNQMNPVGHWTVSKQGNRSVG
eukprot:665909-Alexandrium_andersonii.AAC.1